MADNATFQSSTLATLAAAVKVAADETTYSGDTALVQVMRAVSVTGAEGSRTVVELYANRSDTFTTTGNGTTVDASTRPMRSFGIQVTGTGATATAWTVVVEGSLDNTTFTTILTHVNGTNANGATVWSSAVNTPCLYFRARCSALTLGSATNVVAVILGVP